MPQKLVTTFIILYLDEIHTHTPQSLVLEQNNETRECRKLFTNHHWAAQMLLSVHHSHPHSHSSPLEHNQQLEKYRGITVLQKKSLKVFIYFHFLLPFLKIIFWERRKDNLQIMNCLKLKVNPLQMCAAKPSN